MAINQNHLFEELNGIKCAIVEKNVAAARVAFLRGILEYNRYTVVVVGSPPPKAAPAPAATPASAPGAAPPNASAAASAPVAIPATVPAAGTSGPGAGGDVVPPSAPETFTVGVTDVTFNPVNAIFGRLLKTTEGHIVTLAYWQQKDKESHDEVPYFEGIG